MRKCNYISGSLFAVLLVFASHLGLASGGPGAPIPVSIPATPVGRLLSGFVQAINSNDPNLIASFVSKHFVLTGKVMDSWPTSCCSEAQLDITLGNISKRSGGLAYDAVYPRGTGITAFVTSRNSGHKIYLSLETTAATPDKISSYQVVETPPDVGEYLPKLAESVPIEERVRIIGQAFEKAANRDQYSGTVLIARQDKILFSGAYGFANKEAGTRNTIDTRFGIASTGKLFTGVAVAQLVSSGKLAYDVPIIRYLPDYPNKEAASKITLRELLTHASGLADIFAKERPSTPLNTLADYYPLFANEPLLFEPGKGQSYSNTGFLVASMVVEAVSGEEFRHYLKSHIFDPAGMTHTGWGSPSDLARPYMRDNAEDPLDPNPPWVRADAFYNGLLGGPALGPGGEFSTVTDLMKFAFALQSGAILGRDAFSQLIRDGLACQSANTAGHRIYAHPGGGPGIDAGLKLYVDQDAVAVFLSNYSPPFPQLLANEAGDAIVGP